MSSRLYILVAALVGIVTGFVSIHSLFEHSWTSIFLWIGIGLVIIYFSRNRSNGIWSGVVYGFLTIATWLITGFQGNGSQIKGILLIISIASPLAALSGAIGAIIFYRLFRKSSL